MAPHVPVMTNCTLVHVDKVGIIITLSFQWRLRSQQNNFTTSVNIMKIFHMSSEMVVNETILSPLPTPQIVLKSVVNKNIIIMLRFQCGPSFYLQRQSLVPKSKSSISLSLWPSFLHQWGKTLHMKHLFLLAETILTWPETVDRKRTLMQMTLPGHPWEFIAG